MQFACPTCGKIVSRAEPFSFLVGDTGIRYYHVACLKEVKPKEKVG
jgi:hypothetical protein